MKSAPFHGLLVLDKPGGMTSRAALDRALGWFPRHTRMGHSGTLDPLATGVLVLCVGSATRLAEYVQAMSKTYLTSLLLGARSDTDDADGAVTAQAVEELPDPGTVLRATQAFVGEIEQVPPAYSAAKLSGRRAYDLARQGREVKLRPRQIHINRIEILEYQFPRLTLAVDCGKGTYIRSLARDLGDRLGCGALVESLRRMRVGPLSVDKAVNLDSDGQTVRNRLLPLAAAVAELPHWVLDAAQIARLRHGQSVPIPPHVQLPDPMPDPPRVALFDRADNLVAVAILDPDKGLLRPEKVLVPWS